MHTSRSPIPQGRLLERERELSLLRAELDAVLLSGQGRVVVIEGPGGIGKTALLQELRSAVQAAGVTLLTGRGGEFERQFPFGVARQLLEPVLAGSTDADRAALLAGAAAGAEMALGDVPPEAAPGGVASDQIFRAMHAQYWLVANLTALRGPVVLLVDDLQWADTSSLRFLAFLARRADELPVLLLATLRTDEPEVDTARLAELVRGPLSTSIRPAPLSVAAVAEMVQARLGASAAPGFCAACHEVTSGNPALLRELLIALGEEGVRPLEQEAARVRQIGPDAISDAVLLRLAARPAPALALAKAAAVLGDDTDISVAADLAGLDPETAAEAADVLSATEILERRHPLSFVHPVVRSSIYRSIAPGERSRLHARAAALLRARGSPSRAIAAHLLATDPRQDPEVAALLHATGASALAAGAPLIAAVYLRRALREPVPREQRPAVLRLLGTAEARAGEPSALETLREAIGAAQAPEDRVRAALECSRALMLAGRAGEAAELLERVGLDVREEAPELALELEAQQLMTTHGFRSVRERVGRRLEDVPERPSVGDRILLAVAAIEEAMAGRSADRAAELAERALADGVLLEAVGPEGPPLQQAVGAQVLAGRLTAARQTATAAIELARRHGSAAGFAVASAGRGLIEYHAGDLDAAEADARHALDSGPETWQLIQPLALGVLIEVLVEAGELDEAGRIAARASITGPAEGTVLQELLIGALGRLSHARGDAAGALSCYREVGERQEAWGATTPSIFPWRSHAALAHMALGDQPRAASLALDELERARAFGAPRMIGMALRAAALTAEGDEQPALLREAVAVLERSGARLEHARALVDLGAAIRRRHHRTEARDPLRLGLDIAHRCRAGALAARAREELVAAGARPRRAVLTGADALTASERRVATMASQGLSNRAIAQALFVSLRTVEYHLGNAYRKLGIGSRTELPAALSPGGTPTPPP